MYASKRATPKPRKSELKQYIAPVQGWIANRALADARSLEGPGAAILDNFVPQQTGVKLRRGKARYATLVEHDLPVISLFTYHNGNNRRLFAGNANTVYDITTVPWPFDAEIVTENEDLIVTGTGDWFGLSSTAGLEVITGTTGGDWVTTQFATTGGVFLVGVNGTDVGFIYDGVAFAALDGITFALTGLTTADMSFVWAYKNRLWFIQKDSLSAWYLEVDSIAGEATEFPMGGVFNDGGALLFGQKWSMETSGDGGLSEQNTFTTTLGEVAVYQGSNPDDASDWQKVGVYRIGTPLGKHAWIRGGGDLVICTTVGLVPLSKAISLEVTALSVATVSYKIADAWSMALANRGPVNWQAHIWAEGKMALIGPPDIVGGSNPAVFVSNTDDGTWCRFTNWMAHSFATFEGLLYFGSSDGKVFVGNVSGQDDGEPYTGIVIPLHEDLGAPASSKIGTVARARVRAKAVVDDQITTLVDYDVTPPAAPNASVLTDLNVWGTGIWGTSKWGELTPNVIVQPWRSIGGIGYSMSVCYQVTSGSIAPIDVEVIDFQMLYNTTEQLG